MRWYGARARCRPFARAHGGSQPVASHLQDVGGCFLRVRVISRAGYLRSVCTREASELLLALADPEASPYCRAASQGLLQRWRNLLALPASAVASLETVLAWPAERVPEPEPPRRGNPTAQIFAQDQLGWGPSASLASTEVETHPPAPL
jgi:hypothetical protein